MRAIRCTLISLLSLLFGTTGFAADVNHDGWERILVPVALSFNQEIHGSYGSTWKMQLWLHNVSTRDLGPIQLFNDCGSPCPVSFPAGSPTQARAIESNHGNGALLHIPADIADKIFFSARLLETSRRAQPTGVNIPVVREGSFFENTTSYQAIPVGLSIRSTLRVYDPLLIPGSRVRVDFRDENGLIVATRELAPGNDPALQQQYPGYELYPGVDAIYDITSAVPELQSHARYTVTITPLTPGMKYWAFVNVADNESQHVLFVTAE